MFALAVQQLNVTILHSRRIWLIHRQISFCVKQDVNMNSALEYSGDDQTRRYPSDTLYKLMVLQG